MKSCREIIINFHGVGDVPGHVGSDEARYWLETDFFKRVLDLLDEQHLDGGIRITFDDGNSSDLDLCLPILKMHERSAIFFVLAGRLKRPGYLSSDGLRMLLHEGMAVGSHGFDHVDWRKLDDQQLHYELFAARDILQAACEHMIRDVAIPFGAYNNRVIRSVKSAGYQNIYTSDGGTSHVAHRIKTRTSLRRDMSLQDVERIFQRRESLARGARRAASMVVRQYF
jgi:peptidoglycan/xylan/chitin deacetylase (PgdA/CDA1 family)